MSYWDEKQVNIRPVGTSCRRHIVTKTRLRFPDVPQTSYCDENKTKFFKRPADVVWTSTCDQKKPLTKLDVETNTGRPGDQALLTGY